VLAAHTPPAEARQALPVLTLERAVIVMRHGIRAPLAGEVPEGTRVAQPWPDWPVAAGALTPHGAAAIARLARYDRRWLTAAGLELATCPAAGSVTIWANTEQRTIATGDAYAGAFAPGCGLVVGHRSTRQVDPLFEPLRAGATAFDADRAVAGIDRYTGGMAAQATRYRGAMALLDTVLGCKDTPCSPAARARVTPSPDGRGIDLAGAIRQTSGIAQVLLLEYAEGMPRGAVGWGRADAATIRRLGALHAALFDVFTRSPYMAAHQASVLGQRILATLTASQAPRLDVLVGHDTNVTALAGALHVDLVAPGFARNDAAPGGALIVERLRDRSTGARFVRLSYRVQPLAALRAGTPETIRVPIVVPGCVRVSCPLDRFVAILRSRIVTPG